MSIDRRSFLKGALATGAVAAGGAALAGCSPSESGGDTTGGGGTTTEGALHTWEVVPDPITDIAETKDFDVVVVGAGIAGLNAAEAAGRNGASVALIERTDSVQLRGMDNGNIGSKWHKENGFDIDPHIPGRMLHMWANQTTNYNLISTWTNRSGEVFDYIQQLLAADNVEFVHAVSGTAKYGWDTLPAPWTVYPDAVSFLGPDDNPLTGERPDGSSVQWNLGDALIKSAESNDVEFVYNAHAEQLVGDAETGVTGVIVTAEDGSYVQYNASKGVILATGDICGNQEMIDAWAPICNRSDANVYSPAGGNTGDAILMTSWIGGGISKSPAAPMIHQFTLDTFTFNLTAFIMCWLAVNRNGERYGAEMPFEPYLNNARNNTPGDMAWSIFDADYETYMQMQWPDKWEQWMSSVPAEVEKRVADGTLLQADTLEDLASQLGIPADTFAATVERYNSMYDAGVDTDFDVPAQFLSKIQSPPFYATPLLNSTLTIPFGVHVNDDSQVCTPEDEPIAGLFAVGNAQGDFFGNDYPVCFPGVSHGRSITFGQLVGDALAKGSTITQTSYSGV